MSNLFIMGGASAAGGFNVTTAASPKIPAPLYSPSEAPASMNIFGYIQDGNGDWHTQLGVDTQTVMPTGVPQGVLTFTRKTFFRDNQLALQGGKNAFVSVNHGVGIGLSASAQDRAIWASASNVTGTIQNFSITNNVVTIRAINLAGGGSAFFPNQTVACSSLSTGTYLNGAQLTILTVAGIGTAANTITAAFIHADVGLTSDSGQLDIVMHSMTVLQGEMDIFGTPTGYNPSPAPDAEMSALSFQVSDSHSGFMTAANYGVNVSRFQYYWSGTGTWNTPNPPAVSKFIMSVNTSADGLGMTLQGVVVAVDDLNNSAVNVSGRGVYIVAPGHRLPLGNTGLHIGDFGTNALDYAINVVGGKSNFGGDVSVSGKFSPSSWSNQAANAVLAGPTSGAAAGATFRTLVAADLSGAVMAGDSGSGGTIGAVPAPAAGDAAANRFLSAAGTWATPSVPASSVAWDALTAPSASLALTMAGWNSTFSHSSAATWKFANTTAATNLGVNQSSPLLSLSGRYFSAGVDTEDKWTLQNSIGAAAISATVTNILESSASLVTLTITGGTFTAGQQVTFTGLTTGTWLNGQNAVLATASATSLTFTDPTAHGAQATHAETGQVTQANPASVLSFAHTGSLGGASTTPNVVAISIPVGNGGSGVPNLVSSAATVNGADATTTSGIAVSPTSGVPMYLCAGVTGGVTFFREYMKGALITQHLYQSSAGWRSISTTSSFGVTTGAPKNISACNVGAGASTLFNATSGYQIPFSVGTITTTEGGGNAENLVRFAPVCNAVSTTGAAFITSRVYATVNQAINTGSITNYSITTNVVTFTLSTMGTAFANPDGDSVVISGIASPNDFLNGTWPVNGTPTTTQLKVNLTHANVGSTAITGTATQQATGNYTGLQVRIVETALGGTANLLLDLQSGAAGATGQFAVSNTGKIVIPTTNTASTVGAPGAASALPATPSGYLIVNIGGTDCKIPYFAT